MSYKEGAFMDDGSTREAGVFEPEEIRGLPFTSLDRIEREAGTRTMVTANSAANDNGNGDGRGDYNLLVKMAVSSGKDDEEARAMHLKLLGYS
jgi:hypothetical protein